MTRLAVIVALVMVSSAATAEKGSAAKKSTADRIVMVWEDATLYTAPDESSLHAVANRPVLPRARRPFLFVDRKGEWIRVQSFTTADVGRVAICPLPGLTDLQVHLYVRAADIAETIAIDSLPARANAMIEYQLDGCRNPDAKPIATAIPEGDPRFEPPDLEAPPVGIGPYLAPKTPLYWADGRGAGFTRYSLALPINTYQDGDKVCIDRHLLGPGAFGLAASKLRLCAAASKVKRR